MQKNRKENKKMNTIARVIRVNSEIAPNPKDSLNLDECINSMIEELNPNEIVIDIKYINDDTAYLHIGVKE